MGRLRSRTVSTRVASLEVLQDKQGFNANKGGCTQNTQMVSARLTGRQKRVRSPGAACRNQAAGGTAGIRFEVIGASHLPTRSQEPCPQIHPHAHSARRTRSRSQAPRDHSACRICVFRVHHLVSALKFSFLIPPADGCGRLDVPSVYQMCNAFQARDASQEQAVKTSARTC